MRRDYVIYYINLNKDTTTCSRRWRYLAFIKKYSFQKKIIVSLLHQIELLTNKYQKAHLSILFATSLASSASDYHCPTYVPVQTSLIKHISDELGNFLVVFISFLNQWSSFDLSIVTTNQSLFCGTEKFLNSV